LTEIDGIDDIIEGYLVRTEFKEGKHKGEEYCAAKDLPEAAQPLFIALGLQEKDKVYNVLRIRGRTVSRLTPSSADLISIQASGADPTIDGKKVPPEVAVKDGSVMNLLNVAVPSNVKK